MIARSINGACLRRARFRVDLAKSIRLSSSAVFGEELDQALRNHEHIHQPVMLSQVLDLFGRHYDSLSQEQPLPPLVDGTFGGGGHTAALLYRLRGKVRVVAFDRDESAFHSSHAPPWLSRAKEANLLECHVGNFSIKSLETIDAGSAGGILLDVGLVSCVRTFAQLNIDNNSTCFSSSCLFFVLNRKSLYVSKSVQHKLKILNVVLVFNLMDRWTVDFRKHLKQ